MLLRDGGEAVARGRPFTFLQAAAFQWVNPKAWVMAVTAMAVYTNPDNHTFTVLLVVTILIVGALTFLPVLALGPIAEHVSIAAGQSF